MTNPSKDLLATTEGVDEGSAKSTVEGEMLAGERGPDAHRGTALGEGPADVEATPAPPVDTESAESRGARDAAGTGQQLQEGEG